VNLLRAAPAVRTSLTALTLGIVLSTSSYTPLFAATTTTTPIKNVVVIFQENISFDHYFATYPNAQNNAGETPFTALTTTPSVNGLSGAYASPNNPSLNLAGTATVEPKRMGPNDAVTNPATANALSTTTCSNNHSYQPEQQAYDKGQNDLFVQKTGSAGTGCAADNSTVMNYFDGNTVTALWNYAQHFAISDNSYSSMYGPSTVGALNLIAGNTQRVVASPGVTQTLTGGVLSDAPGVLIHFNNQTTGLGGTATETVVGSDNSGTSGNFSILGDVRPYGDDCDPNSNVLTLDSIGNGGTHRNIGDLLNTAGLSWGWFQGGFAATSYDAPNPSVFPQTGQPLAVCGSLHEAADGTVKVDYIAHHQPFQFFASTANPHHLAPANAAEVGHAGLANHQYDISNLFNVTSTSSPTSRSYTINGLAPGVTLPAVTFIKAPGFMDGHPQYSNPLLEQQFVTQVINTLMQSSYWPNMAIIIAYDDSDGWYDHVVPPLVNPSQVASANNNTGSLDALTAVGSCGTPATGAVNGRCGYGPRQPFIVISPFSKINFVDHTVIDQSSIIRFIEDNWTLGRINSTPTPVSQGGSFDQVAGSLLNMFNFTTRHSLDGLILNTTTGAVVSGGNNL
jgi:phospholipase C